MVLYRSPVCCRCAEAYKYMTICCISFHPCRSMWKQVWHKNGQGQPRVIIWTHLKVFEYLILYTKFQGHQPLGSEVFFHICAWKPSWSCDPEQLNKFSFPTSHGGSIWNLASIAFVFFEEEKFENVESKWAWTKVSEWIWLWAVIKHHVLIYLTICTNFHLTGFNSFSEIYSLSIVPSKSKMDQIWPCCKICQGHHLNKLDSTWITNAAYQVSRSSAFWFQRRRFFKGFTIYWHGGHLSIVTNHLNSFSIPNPMEAPHEFNFNQPSSF